MPNKRPVKQGFSYDCGASQMDQPKKRNQKLCEKSSRNKKSNVNGIRRNRFDIGSKYS